MSLEQSRRRGPTYVPNSEAIRNPVIFERSAKAERAATLIKAKITGVLLGICAAGSATIGAVRGFNDEPQATFSKKAGTIDDLNDLDQEEKLNLTCLRESLYEEYVAPLISTTNLTRNKWANDNCKAEYFGDLSDREIVAKKNELLENAGYSKTDLTWYIKKDEYGGKYLEETINND